MEYYKIRKQKFKKGSKSAFSGLWKYDNDKANVTYDESLKGDASLYVPAKGYVVVDADGKNAIAFVEKVISFMKEKPFSYTSTGGNGKHFIFKCPKGFEDKITSIVKGSPYVGKDSHDQVDLKGNEKGILYFRKVNKNDGKSMLTEKELNDAFKNAPVMPTFFAINHKSWKGDRININDIGKGEWNDTVMTKLYGKLKANGWDKEQSRGATIIFLAMTDRDIESHMTEFDRDFDKAFALGVKDKDKEVLKHNLYSFLNIDDAIIEDWRQAFTYQRVGKVNGQSRYIISGVNFYNVIANHVIKENKLQKSFDDNQIWGLERGIFKHIDVFDELIKSFIIKETQNIKPSVLSGIVQYIESALPLKAFMKNKFAVSFLDKTIDVTTLTDIEIKDGYMNQNTIPHNLIDLKENRFSDETKEVLDKIMNGWSKGIKQVAKELYELIGLCMTKYMEHGKSYFLLGNANNGKSVFLEFLTNILGKHNVSNVDIVEVSNDKFTVVDYYGKLANINADISSTTIENTSLFKKTSTGDTIRGQHKNSKAFTFAPYATQVYGANEIPYAMERGNSDGFNRRLKIIPFNNVFKGLTEKDKNNIRNGINSKEIIELAIVRALKAIHKALTTKQGFTNSAVSKRALEKVKKEMNHMFWFVEENEIIDNEPVVDAYKRYKDWCKQYEYKHMMLDNFVKKYEHASRTHKGVIIIKHSYSNGGAKRHKFIIFREEEDE